MRSNGQIPKTKTTRLLISGGPGSGCTSTAVKVSESMGIPLFDSDSFFHKPSDPPFQEQNSPEDRRTMLEAALSAESDWIVSGSVATWELKTFDPTHGVLLKTPREIRLQRLVARQQSQFGDRLKPGGDMYGQNRAFMDWAADYEARSGRGRNLSTDQSFLVTRCDDFMTIEQEKKIDIVVERITDFLTK